MNILHIIDSGGLYGAEIMLLNLVDIQQKLGLKPIIASIGDKNIDEKLIEKESRKRGFPVVCFRMLPGPNIAGAFRILRYAKKKKINIIHSHGYKMNILFGFMPRFVRKIPVITTLHGWTSTGGFSKLMIYEWLDSISLSLINTVVLVNKGMLLSKKLKRKKRVRFKVINNGIPIKNTLEISSDSQIIEFCKKRFTIGTIGRLSSEKGYNFLIESLFLLTKKGLKIQLVIIGEGDRRKKLEELIRRYNLSELVLLPGYRNNAKRYLSHCNLYAISSITEGLPISLLEAMQAKVPIVATNVGGIPDVLDHGKCGLLVQPRDPHQLANAIHQIYINQNFSDMLIESAYQRLIKHYSSDIMANKYLKLYNEFI